MTDRTGIARGLPSLVCFPLALYFSPFVSATSTDGTASLVIAFDLIELATCKDSEDVSKGHSSACNRRIILRSMEAQQSAWLYRESCHHLLGWLCSSISITPKRLIFFYTLKLPFYLPMFRFGVRPPSTPGAA
ncbi:hypothetical protein SDJN03_05848, partial [Cucurbita argyrosperma subsp. sororia]